jgi:putative endonuclease
MSKNSHSIGNFWEVLIVNFLLTKGFQIIERRYSSRGGEIDIIYTIPNRKIIVFAEVKYRNSIQDFSGIITNKKFERIFNTSLSFLKLLPQYLEFTPQFDFIFVQKNGEIEHIENISF